MVIRNVTPDIVTMSLPFARFGIMRFGGRGTLGESGCPYRVRGWRMPHRDLFSPLNLLDDLD